MVIPCSKGYIEMVNPFDHESLPGGQYNKVEQNFSDLLNKITTLWEKTSLALFFFHSHAFRCRMGIRRLCHGFAVKASMLMIVVAVFVIMKVVVVAPL